MERKEKTMCEKVQSGEEPIKQEDQCGRSAGAGREEAAESGKA